MLVSFGTAKSPSFCILAPFFRFFGSTMQKQTSMFQVMVLVSSLGLKWHGKLGISQDVSEAGDHGPWGGDFWKAFFVWHEVL